MKGQQVSIFPRVWLAGALACSLLLTACGSVDDAGWADGAGTDDPMFFFCAEGRGGMYDLNQMLAGAERVDTSALGYAAGHLRVLAEKVSAPPEVTADLDRWDAALTTWRDALRAFPPRFENGRVIEPDTSAINHVLMSDLKPIGERVGKWHTKVCDK